MGLNTLQLTQRLAERYSGQEWAFFRNVGEATGGGSTRRADGIAMNLWPSRGLAVIGFECKISRSDLLRELKTPVKAEAFAPHCDQWYLVLGDKDLIKDGELPASWGLVVPRGEGLAIVKEATVRPDVVLRRDFVAALLRAAKEYVVTPEDVTQRVDDAFRRGRAAAKGGDEATTDKIKNLEALINTFEEASGLRMRSYSGPKQLGDAVRAVMDKQGTLASRISTMERDLRIEEKDFARQRKWKEESLAELRALAEQFPGS